jgi:hypothetical protein
MELEPSVKPKATAVLPQHAAAVISRIVVSTRVRNGHRSGKLRNADASRGVDLPAVKDPDLALETQRYEPDTPHRIIARLPRGGCRVGPHDQGGNDFSGVRDSHGTDAKKRRDPAHTDKQVVPIGRDS